MAECCNYLGAQMTKSEPKASTVTLLTSEPASNKLSKRSFSLQTLAEAAGKSSLPVVKGDRTGNARAMISLLTVFWLCRGGPSIRR